MARRRRRGGRKGGLRGIFRKTGSAIGSGVIIIGLSAGAIRTGMDVAGGLDPRLIPNNLVLHYTGFNPAQGSFDQNEAVVAWGTILGSIVAGKLIKFAARSV